jgi:hypothetical protein
MESGCCSQALTIIFQRYYFKILINIREIKTQSFSERTAFFDFFLAMLIVNLWYFLYLLYLRQTLFLSMFYNSLETKIATATSGTHIREEFQSPALTSMEFWPGWRHHHLCCPNWLVSGSLTEEKTPYLLNSKCLLSASFKTNYGLIKHFIFDIGKHKNGDETNMKHLLLYKNTAIFTFWC